MKGDNPSHAQVITNEHFTLAMLEKDSKSKTEHLNQVFDQERFSHMVIFNLGN